MPLGQEKMLKQGSVEVSGGLLGNSDPTVLYLILASPLALQGEPRDTKLRSWRGRLRIKNKGKWGRGGD